ncbi:MAG: DNA mismatch repair endonuclease MutL [Gemmatimonadetes bacterium]|nr:DNA mismatch repair endonuclease MutL [Gemmatimonadota bacterium]
MGKIAVLPRTVADQIAAGEVVERPASVVKELVENALDAGASAVTVELEEGGRGLVRVSDDGTGMDRDDTVLAVERHATSKIHSAAELVGVATYGFRGEALSAIASVSKFEMETANGTDGTKVTVTGGRLERVEPVARQRGTTVEVRQIFYNTPARRKFLRSQRSETRAASEALTVLALARLDVHFKLVSDGRVLLDAPRASNVADRIALLFGAVTATGLIPVDGVSGGITVRGFIQRPAEARPAGRKAYLFVNGRPFRDHFLVRAAEAGYRSTIHPGGRPTLFLSIGIPGDAVDVNVHPAKLEVRFRDRMLVERAIEDAVRGALGGGEAAAEFRGERGNEGTGERSLVPLFARSFDSGAQLDSLFDQRSTGASSPAAAPWHGPTAILQVLSTYLLFETPEGIAIVDQHSAHERVLYERTMAQLSGPGAPSQRLLLPLTLDLSPPELEVIETHGDLLNAAGFEVEPFGGRSVVVHAVPNPHPRFDAKRCLEEMVADFARGRFGGWHNRLERFAATYACRAAIKAGQTLGTDEMRDLLARLFACDLPPHDVHGRPTIVQLPRDELERRFGRA